MISQSYGCKKIIHGDCRGQASSCLEEGQSLPFPYYFEATTVRPEPIMPKNLKRKKKIIVPRSLIMFGTVTSKNNNNYPANGGSLATASFPSDIFCEFKRK